MKAIIMTKGQQVAKSFPLFEILTIIIKTSKKLLAIT